MKWESLIEDIVDRRIVPVLGNNLSLVRGKDKLPVPLYDHLAKELREKLKTAIGDVQENLLDDRSLHELALIYKDADEVDIADKIFSIYKDIMEEESFCTEALEKLAAITDFEFYISTSIDDLLEKSLQKVRGGEDSEMNVINYSLRGNSPPKGKKPNVEVFNLMGNIFDLKNFALNEEQMLEHFFSIAGKEYDEHPQAKHFLEQVENKKLLFIGWDFSDWFMRFVVRFLTNRRYGGERKSKDYIFFSSGNGNHKLEEFLAHFRKVIFNLSNEQKNSDEDFIDRLYREWVSKKEVVKPVKHEGSVFLNYVSENQKEVEAFKDTLKSKGVEAWFDKEDLPPGEHKKLIPAQIKKSKVFIPFISDAYLNARGTDRYAWETELATAEKLLAAKEIDSIGSFNFLPCILDNTNISDNRIPDFMKKYGIMNLNSQKDKIINDITDLLTIKR